MRTFNCALTFYYDFHGKLERIAASFTAKSTTSKTLNAMNKEITYAAQVTTLFEKYGYDRSEADESEQFEDKTVSVENDNGELQRFRFKVYYDHVELADYLSRSIFNVTIPDMVYGRPVTIIGRSCFCNHSEIRAVRLPKPLLSIEDDAFVSCKGIREIEIPESVTRIEPSAFRDCTSLNYDNGSQRSWR